MSRRLFAGPLVPALALRLLRGGRRGLLGSTARAALAASALGTAALGVAMALMTGYREDLQAKLLGGNAAILVYPRGAEGELAPEDLTAIRALPGVTRVDRVGFVQGVLSGPAGEAEVTLRGAPPGAGMLAGGTAELARDGDGVAGALLGAELARQIGARPGDLIRLTALGLGDGRARFTFRSLRMARTFETGFSEFDRAWASVAPDTLAGLPGARAVSFEVALADARRAPEVAEMIRARLGPDALVADWTQLNRELFAALRLQQRALFLLLGLIVVVATFNVASTLVVLVRERRRDLGVLAALGLPPAAIRQVFLFYGLLLGGLGTGLGLALAGAIAWAVDRFHLLSFGPEVAAIYFLSSVPMRLSALDVAAIALLSIGVTLLACWFPARRAGNLEPATALQYE